jgi:hypothetical protein
MATDLENQLKNIKRDYRITFGSKEGERVIADLRSAYYKRSSFSKDTNEMAYREGQRSVVIRIINLLEEEKKWLMSKRPQYKTTQYRKHPYLGLVLVKIKTGDHL